MRKTVTIAGQEISLATITVGDLETIELSGKTGRKFNIALVALAVLASGDKEHGSEEWVRTIPVFSESGGDPPFQTILAAANEVNGLSAPKGESGPAAPAAE